jgi:hypothetical protein
MAFAKGHGKIEDHEYLPEVWFERDRACLSLRTPKGRCIFVLWDEDVHQAIEDGFMTTPCHPRPSDQQWQPHLVAYAREQGLIT